MPLVRTRACHGVQQGQPGPMKFNRTEADGANLFGSVLNPLPGLGEGNLPGVAIWRSFSHPDSSSPPPMNDQAYFQYLLRST